MLRPLYVPHIPVLQTCQRPLPVEDGILPTKLYTHRCARWEPLGGCSPGCG